MIEDLDLFEDLQLDSDTNIKAEPKVKEKAQKEPKKKKKKTATKDKSEVKAELPTEDAEDLLSEEVLKEEEEADAKSSKKEKVIENIVYVDAQNTDDRKKISQLMKEGKTILDDKSRPFILTEWKKDPYSYSNPVIYKVYCDEILSVNIRTYYMDLELMEATSRTVVRKDIWVHHKGYRTFAIITDEQLRYLLDNKFVTSKMIKYNHIDVSTGVNFYLGNDSNEPDLKKIGQFVKQNKANYKTLSSGISGETETEEVISETEEEMAIVELEESVEPVDIDFVDVEFVDVEVV